MKVYINVEWDGENQDTYKNFYITDKIKTNIIKKFDTGNPIIDWVDVMAYITQNYEFFQMSISFDCEMFMMNDNNHKWYGIGYYDGKLIDSSDYIFRFIIDNKIKTLNDLTVYYNKYYRKEKINKIFDLI